MNRRCRIPPNGPRMSRRTTAKLESTDPKKSARVAGVAYVTDEQRGFGRVKRGRGFRMLIPAIESCAIPGRLLESSHSRSLRLD
jgi:hypothetical protein